MAATIKDKATDTGRKIAESAKTVGQNIAEGAEKATEWVKEKAHVNASTRTTDTIAEHMEVIASCGKHVGVVDRVEGDSLKLTKSDPAAAGLHHYIPMNWVEKVDKHVHLNKNSEEVFQNWTAETSSCCGG